MGKNLSKSKYFISSYRGRNLAVLRPYQFGCPDKFRVYHSFKQLVCSAGGFELQSLFVMEE